MTESGFEAVKNAAVEVDRCLGEAHLRFIPLMFEGSLPSLVRDAAKWCDGRILVSRGEMPFLRYEKPPAPRARHLDLLSLVAIEERLKAVCMVLQAWLAPSQAWEDLSARAGFEAAARCLAPTGGLMQEIIRSVSRHE